MIERTGCSQCQDRLKTTYIILFVFLAFTSAAIAGDNDTPTLVLYAFAAEGQLLSESMEINHTDTVLGRPVHRGTLSGQDIILAESGVGMTNAAMTGQKLIDKYSPARLVFSGIAGGIDSAVNIGDIVVCDRWVTHDYGYHGPDSFQVSRIDIYDPGRDSIIEQTFFAVDSALLATAGLLDPVKLNFDKIGDRIPRLIVGGAGASGNSFIDNAAKRLWLFDHLEARTVDMESAAVAQVCTVNGLPFIIFRSASDLAGGAKTETATAQLRQFFRVAAANSATVVMAFLNTL